MNPIFRKVYALPRFTVVLPQFDITDILRDIGNIIRINQCPKHFLGGFVY